MRALFDTNILIDEVDGRMEADRELRFCDEAYTSRIVWIEALVGAKAEHLGAIQTVLSSLVVLELTPQVAAATIALRQRFSRLKLPDAMIYATAQVHGLTLVTRNLRDFNEDMPGVRIPYSV